MISNNIKHDSMSLHTTKWSYLELPSEILTHVHWPSNSAWYCSILLAFKKPLKYMYCEHRDSNTKLGIIGIWKLQNDITWLTRTAKFDLLIEIVCYKWHHITLLNNHTSQSIIMCNNSIITITRKVQTYKPWNPLVMASYNSYRFTHNISRSDTDKTFTRGRHLTIIVTN